MTIFLLLFAAGCLLCILWACLYVAAERNAAEQELSDMEQIAAVSRPADLEGTK